MNDVYYYIKNTKTFGTDQQYCFNICTSTNNIIGLESPHGDYYSSDSSDYNILLYYEERTKERYGLSDVELCKYKM